MPSMSSAWAVPRGVADAAPQRQALAAAAGPPARPTAARWPACPARAGPSPGRRCRRAARRQGALQPPAPLGPVAAGVPEPRQRRPPAQPQLRLAGPLRPGERGPQVVVLGRQPVQPGGRRPAPPASRRLARPGPGSRRRGARASPPPRRSPPAAPARTRGPSPASRSAARRPARSCRTQQALVDQRRDAVERRRAPASPAPPRDRLGRLQRAAADEDGQAAEERLLRRRRAGRGSRRWRRASSAAGPAGRGRRRSAAAGGAPAGPAAPPAGAAVTRAAASSIASGSPSRRCADLGDGGRVRGGRGRSPAGRPRARCDEERAPPRTRPGSSGGRRGGRASGSASGRHRELVLAATGGAATRLVASTVRPRAGAEQGRRPPGRPPRPARSCRAPAAAAGRARTPARRGRRRRSSAELAHAEGLGDGRRGRGAGRRAAASGDEGDAVGERGGEARPRRGGPGGSCRRRRGRSGSPGGRRRAAAGRATAATSRSRPTKVVSGVGRGAPGEPRSGERDEGHRLGAAPVGGRRVGHGRVLRRSARAAIFRTTPVYVNR